MCQVGSNGKACLARTTGALDEANGRLEDDRDFYRDVQEKFGTTSGDPDAR